MTDRRLTRAPYPDGSAKRRLTMRDGDGDGDPTWSPDGRRIAYMSSSPTSSDLWVAPRPAGRHARSCARLEQTRARRTGPRTAGESRS
jgi:Tol biopolymer transport system component